jgi:hypothetical protein
VLRLLAAEGMVSLGLLSLDGTKLAGNAAQKANKTLPQIGKLLAEAAAADAAEDARQGEAEPGQAGCRLGRRGAGMGAAAADRHLPAELASADAVFGLAWCPPTALTGGGSPVRGRGRSR